MNRLNLLVLSAGLIFAGCTAQKQIRVLPEGASEIKVQYGGIMTDQVFGFPAPAPQITTGIAHGLSERVTVIGDFHVTSFVFSLLHISTGAAFRIRQESGWQPELTALGNYDWIWDYHDTGDRSFAMYPSISLIASHQVRNQLLYYGFETFFEFRKNPVQVFKNPFFGWQKPIGKHAIQVELKHNGLGEDNKGSVDFWPQTATGAWALHLGYSWRFSE